MAVTLLSAGSLGPAQSPTLSLPGATAGQGVLVFCVGPVALSVDVAGSDVGWVRDYYKVNNIGFAIFRLPAVSNPGGTLTLKITTNGPRNLAYVAAAGNIGVPLYGNFGQAGSGWTLENGPATGHTGVGTGAHTFASAPHTFAVFPLVDISAGDLTNDITAYDQSYTEVGDSGITPPHANEESRLWLSYKPTTAMASSGVSGTFTHAITNSIIGWCGMAAYDQTAAPTATFNFVDSAGDDMTVWLKTAGGLDELTPIIKL